MPATLIVENGSNVAGANSYNSLVDIKTFAANRGYDLSNFESPTLIGFALLGMDYLESFRDQYKGIKTDATQPLQWPRTVKPIVFSDWTQDPKIPSNVQIDGFDIADDVIPQLIRDAQSQLVIEQAINKIKLFPSLATNRQVKLKKIGPITTEYFASDATPIMLNVEAFLSPLISQGSFATLRTVRV